MKVVSLFVSYLSLLFSLLVGYGGDGEARRVVRSVWDGEGRTGEIFVSIGLLREWFDIWIFEIIVCALSYAVREIL